MKASSIQKAVSPAYCFILAPCTMPHSMSVGSPINTADIHLDMMDVDASASASSHEASSERSLPDSQEWLTSSLGSSEETDTDEIFQPLTPAASYIYKEYVGVDRFIAEHATDKNRSILDGIINATHFIQVVECTSNRAELME